MAEFIVRALAAGLAVALVAGPLGCFVVWRRMAYFGDTLAHSALLGLALGLLLEVNVQAAVIGASALLALGLWWLDKGRVLGTDTLLGILAHGSLALGLLVLSLSEVRVDLTAYLFGDLLTVSPSDLIWILLCCAAALGLLLLFWNRLLTITLHRELAQVEGLDAGRIQLLLMLLIAVVVAVSMKIIGVLLITALLVVPPAAARLFSRTPEGMAGLASLIGCVAVCGGMAASFFWDTPTGPSIVVAAVLCFVLAQAATWKRAP